MAEGATIKPIEASSVHQIQSGQVIVDLCSVAKELVENSLDAGATAIELRFKNQGLDSIEVQDNGSGVAPQNYESLALKHYTSKLSTYADLDTLDTFGFRGEALSSLCALSHFWVTTCLASEAPRGTRLEFETSGKLKGTGVVAAQKGTTVSIETLFYNLPVRRRELERNIKREWGKVINLLNQYACVQTGIKFTVTQQPNKGRRTTLFSTKGNPTTRENIVNVFGAKTMSALITLDLELDLELTAGRSTLSVSGAKGARSTKVRVVGHVSRPARGEGRQTPDRQMFYVNGRPCALPQFAKVFNEVYRAYNSTQSPFIFADIKLDTHLYDVNVSPDKRTILLHEQGRMLENLRESLIELFEIQDITIPTSQLMSTQKQTPFKTPTSVRQASSASTGRQTSGPPRAIVDRDGDTPSAKARDHARSPPSDEDELGEPDMETQPGRSVSSKSLAKDAESLNLISRWAARKAEDRPEQPITARPDEGRDSANEGGLSRNLQDLLAKLRGDGSSTGEQVGPDQEEEDEREKETEENGSDEHGPHPGDAAEKPPTEARIPSINPPRTQSPRAGPTFSSPRPFKRMSPEPATITIGDHTVTGMLGPTSSAKRQKTADNRGPYPSRAGGKAKAPLPSFGGRLSQMFAAASARASPGGSSLGALQTATEEIEDEDEEAPSQDSDVARSGSEDGGDEPSRSENGQDEGSEDEGTDLLPVVAELHPQLEEEENGEREDVDEEIPPEKEEGKDSEHGRCTHANHDGDDDEDYIDEEEKKKKEEEKVQSMIAQAEKAADEPSEEGQKRTQAFLKGASRRKDSTLGLVQRVTLDETSIARQLERWHDSLERVSPAAPPQTSSSGGGDISGGGLEAEAANAEEKLSLTITKSDFDKMKIVGQFNLGFILAVREAADATAAADTATADAANDDELFIIDQHASDEKYNFERLQASTVVQSQRLVRPKTLELTALEEEIIMENTAALEANGFQVEVDTSGDSAVGSRVKLLSLPLSRETTFSLADLEELVSLLADNPATTTTATEDGDGDGEQQPQHKKQLRYVPRPARVRKMFAMRACRSSVMIGRALSRAQMERVVRHMGGMEKPWNCPHGRPTMRHLCGLGAAWDRGMAWTEGDGFDGEEIPVDWEVYDEAGEGGDEDDEEDNVDGGGDSDE